jgi:hypothetical protein
VGDLLDGYRATGWDVLIEAPSALRAVHAAPGRACLAELDTSSGRAGVGDEARRVLGRARNALEFGRVQDLLVDFSSQLRALPNACAEAGDAVRRRFFSQSPVGYLETAARR